jgi:putative peptidoglycan lipid II flippase
MSRSHSGKSLAHRVLRAGFAVSIAHLLFKLAGLWQARVMGHLLPAETYDVVYAFAFENCIFSLFLIGEEVLGPACLPVFMREKDERGEAAAWSFANTVLTLQVILLAVVVACLMAAPGLVTQLLTPWSPTHQPGNYALAADSIRRLAPTLLGLSLGSLTYVLLNSYKRFFLAAFGDAVWKFAVMVALTLFVVPGGHRAATVLIGGLLAGSVLKLATHLVGLRDKIHRIRPSLNLRNPALRRMLWLALPLLVGIVFAKIRDVVNNVYILGELDAAGIMQANSMGRKLQNALHWLVPYTLSIAVFPFFCELVDQSDHARLGSVVTRVGRQLLAIFIPFATIVAVLSIPLTGLIFGGGHFDALAVRRTALAMACYTFALPAAAVEAIVMQAFFANRRMVATTVVGIVFSAFSMGVSWMGLRLGGGRELLVLAAIAGGFALSRVLKTVTLVQLLRRGTPVFPLAGTVGFLARVVLASVVTAAIGGGVSVLVLRGTASLQLAPRLTDLLRLGAGGGAAGLALLAAYWLLRVDEPFELVRLALRKRRRQG